MIEFFAVKTPIGIEVRTTVDYWQYLISKKHPIMNGKEEVVKLALMSPMEIRQSKRDEQVFLYYGQSDKLYCVVVRH